METTPMEEKVLKESSALKAGRYIEAIGRRKNAIARVRIFTGSKNSYEINNREIDDYFPISELRRNVNNVFETADIPEKFKVTIHVNGGGITAQSEAISLGIARALIVFNPKLRDILKKKGYLKRDARVKERKKPGLKKARKASQWSKR
ncbi:MAG: 30S ribosomal protein S9 [Patescibacteria group bacterium]